MVVCFPFLTTNHRAMEGIYTMEYGRYIYNGNNGVCHNFDLCDYVSFHDPIGFRTGSFGESCDIVIAINVIELVDQNLLFRRISVCHV